MQDLTIRRFCLSLDDMSLQCEHVHCATHYQIEIKTAAVTHKASVRVDSSPVDNMEDIDLADVFRGVKFTLGSHKLSLCAIRKFSDVSISPEICALVSKSGSKVFTEFEMSAELLARLEDLQSQFKNPVREIVCAEIANCKSVNVHGHDSSGIRNGESQSDHSDHAVHTNGDAHSPVVSNPFLDALNTSGSDLATITKRNGFVTSCTNRFRSVLHLGNRVRDLMVAPLARLKKQQSQTSKKGEEMKNENPANPECEILDDGIIFKPISGVENIQLVAIDKNGEELGHMDINPGTKENAPLVEDVYRDVTWIVAPKVGPIQMKLKSVVCIGQSLVESDATELTFTVTEEGLKKIVVTKPINGKKEETMEEKNISPKVDCAIKNGVLTIRPRAGEDMFTMNIYAGDQAVGGKSIPTENPMTFTNGRLWGDFNWLNGHPKKDCAYTLGIFAKKLDGTVVAEQEVIALTDSDINTAIKVKEGREKGPFNGIKLPDDIGQSKDWKWAIPEGTYISFENQIRHLSAKLESLEIEDDCTIKSELKKLHKTLNNLETYFFNNFLRKSPQDEKIQEVHTWIRQLLNKQKSLYDKQKEHMKEKNPSETTVAEENTPLPANPPSGGTQGQGGQQTGTTPVVQPTVAPATQNPAQPPTQIAPTPPTPPTQTGGGAGGTAPVAQPATVMYPAPSVTVNANPVINLPGPAPVQAPAQTGNDRTGLIVAIVAIVLGALALGIGFALVMNKGEHSEQSTAPTVEKPAETNADLASLFFPPGNEKLRVTYERGQFVETPTPPTVPTTNVVLVDMKPIQVAVTITNAPPPPPAKVECKKDKRSKDCDCKKCKDRRRKEHCDRQVKSRPTYDWQKPVAVAPAYIQQPVVVQEAPAPVTYVPYFVSDNSGVYINRHSYSRQAFEGNLGSHGYVGGYRYH